MLIQIKNSTFFLILATTFLACISIANGARQNKDTSCSGKRHVRRIQKKIARQDVILERYVNTTLYEIQTLMSDKNLEEKHPNIRCDNWIGHRQLRGLLCLTPMQETESTQLDPQTHATKYFFEAFYQFDAILKSSWKHKRSQEHTSAASTHTGFTAHQVSGIQQGFVDTLLKALKGKLSLLTCDEKHMRQWEKASRKQAKKVTKLIKKHILNSKRNNEDVLDYIVFQDLAKLLSDLDTYLLSR